MPHLATSRLREQAAKTGGYINRPARVGKEGRRLKKLLGKSNWFKKVKKQQEENEAAGGKCEWKEEETEK